MKAALFVTEAKTKGNPVNLDSLKSQFVQITTPADAKALAMQVVSPDLVAYYLELPDDAAGITAYDIVTQGVPL
jgi:hypothetical protein